MAKNGEVNRDTLYKRIADKLDLPQEDVEKAIKYQFEYTTEVMKEGEFESIRLPYFGIFHVKKGRLKHLNNETNE